MEVDNIIINSEISVNSHMAYCIMIVRFVFCVLGIMFFYKAFMNIYYLYLFNKIRCHLSNEYFLKSYDSRVLIWIFGIYIDPFLRILYSGKYNNINVFNNEIINVKNVMLEDKIKYIKKYHSDEFEHNKKCEYFSIFKIKISIIYKLLFGIACVLSLIITMKVSVKLLLAPVCCLFLMRLFMFIFRKDFMIDAKGNITYVDIIINVPKGRWIVVIGIVFVVVNVIVLLFGLYKLFVIFA